MWRLRWCDDDYVGTEDEGGYCVEDYYDHYNYDQEIYKVEVDDHSTRPLANGAVSKASWPTQILARCQILNKGTWHYSDDWAILKFFPMTNPMNDLMTEPKASSLKNKFGILKNASFFVLHVLIQGYVLEKKFCSNIAPSDGTAPHPFTI